MRFGLGTAMGIRTKLGLSDAFDGYTPDPARIDRQGWNSTHPFFEVAIAQTKPKLVIELGVWKGMSVIEMAGLMKKHGIPGEILAIDTWLGSSNHLSSKGRRDELMPENGYPTLYRTFLANVADAGHQDVVVPLPMDGTSAAVALRRMDVKAGLVHIDASHEYEAALADFRSYWPLVEANGMLLADDYASWPSVTRAVHVFAAEVDRPVFASMEKAMIPKDPTLAFEMQYVKAVRYRRTPENS